MAKKRIGSQLLKHRAAKSTRRIKAPIAERLHVCQNCRKEYPESKLDEIGMGGFWERVSPGEIMPSGECPDPDCRALCHPKVEKPHILVSVTGGVAEVIDETVPAGVEVEIVDFDNLKQGEQQDFDELSEKAKAWIRHDDPDLEAIYDM